LVKEKVKEEPLTLSEVKELLEKRSKEGELNYIQRVTLDYVSKHARLPADKARKLLNELVSMGLKPDLAAQIVDCTPITKDELLIFLGKEIKNMDPEILDKIEEKLKEYNVKLL